MKCSDSNQLFPARQQAAILRLYVDRRLPWLEVAARLGLSPGRMGRFLRARGVMRGRGDGQHPSKLTPALRQRLASALPTTRDIVLAKRYGLTRERVRQIRKALGYPSSRVLGHEEALRNRAERRAKEKRARKLRQQARRKAEWELMERLSARWRTGTTIYKLAREEGLRWGCLNSRIVRWRRRYPKKFPYRIQQPGAISRAVVRRPKPRGRNAR